jgi:hypothetical protein
MAQDLITRCLGIVSQYSPLSTSPGALIKGDNISITRENIIQDRRGYLAYGSLNNTTAQLMTYMSTVLAQNSDKVSYDNGSGTFTEYSGTYSPPSGQKMRFVEANNNLYVTTDSGIKVFTDITGTAARQAGAPRCLNVTLALSSAGSPVLVTTAHSAAYQVVVQRTDVNGNVLFGYPSGRNWIANSTGATRDITVTVGLNPEVTTSDVIQVYRTPISADVASDTAGAELYLVYQASPSAGDITAGTFSFTDILIDALATKNAVIYTAPSQQGALQANDIPPLCKDIALYKASYMMYANTQTKQQLSTTLLATASLSTHTLSFYDSSNTLLFTLTSGAAENTATGTFKAFTAGTTAQNIDDTAKSIVNVANRYASNTALNAFYVSSNDSLPGQILFEARSLGSLAFYTLASNSALGNSFFPPIQTATATAATTSSNTIQKNAVYFSKNQELEAVPTLNYLLAGASNKNILRIAPLRDALVIIKEDGVYLLRGESANNFTINPLDLTVICRATDSVVVLANQVIMLSNQGVVAISENGVSVISREIEPNIIPLLTYSAINTATTGISYESERSYFLSTIQTNTDTVQTQTYVYNIFTKTWVRWTFGINAAIVEPTADKLYFGKPTSSTVYKERKDFQDTDYADPEVAIVITSATTSTINFTIIGSVPQVGWTIVQDSAIVSIESIEYIAGEYVATAASDVPDTVVAGAATIYPNVGFDIEWDTWTGQQSAGILKQVRQIVILADNIPGNNSATTIGITFRTNFDEIRDEVSVNIPAGAWGSGAWGTMPWGGSGDTYGYRTFVTKNKQFCMYLNPGVIHRNSRQKLVIAGFSLTYEPIGEKVSK